MEEFPEVISNSDQVHGRVQNLNFMENNLNSRPVISLVLKKDENMNYSQDFAEQGSSRLDENYSSGWVCNSNRKNVKLGDNFLKPLPFQLSLQITKWIFIAH